MWADTLATDDAVRHPAYVRVTHWINTLVFAGLVVSGVAILIAHPRLYWGETGAVGGPSLIDLPIPFLLGHSGWGRYLHFLSAWIAVLTGIVYVAAAVSRGHVRRELMPRRSGDDSGYGPLQRLSYLIVVFAIMPLAILTGLGMSPAIASVFPALVEAFGGHQSARTIHFFVASALVLFAIGHVVMVARAGFVRHVRAMVTGTLR
jgi:thiosulfate reductase cytochrome b subunit